MNITFLDPLSQRDYHFIVPKKPIRGIDLKLKFNKETSLRADSVKFIINENKVLKDNEAYDFSQISWLTYTIYKSPVKVEVSINLDSYESAFIDTFRCCSVLMIKMFLTFKTPYLVENMVIADDMQALDESITLDDLARNNSFISNGIDRIPGERQLFKLNLLIKKPTMFNLGVDLTFNKLKNYQKIEFDNSAPSYREIGDGLNFQVSCQNAKCIIFKQVFLVHLGIGKFELTKEKNNAKCPKCEGKKVSINRLMFVNSQWFFKAKLQKNDNSVVKGEGVTFENKIFFSDEINLADYSLLAFVVKRFLSVPKSDDVCNIDIYGELLSDDRSVYAKSEVETERSKEGCILF